MKNYPHLQVDLSNCDKEPIHLIGRIQAHGYLLILDPITYRLEQVSANVGEWCGMPAEGALGCRLQEVLPAEVSRTIICKAAGQQNSPFTIRLADKSYLCALCFQRGKLLLEIEPVSDERPEYLQELQHFLWDAICSLNGEQTLEELAGATANLLGDLLSYDRVMIYRFDEDYHGHVMAEKVKEGVKSYDNHHFPASDIPLQAREMLLRTRIRQISNVWAEGVNILPYLHPKTSLPTDIGDSMVRNPSEIHVEYLKNMGAAASISLAIEAGGRLWGLVCCQHETPRFIDYYTRNIASLLTAYFAKALLSASERQDQALAARYREVEKALLAQMEEDLNILEGLFAKPLTILDLMQAGGAAIYLNGKLTCIGQTPTPKQIESILDWACNGDLPGVWSTREFYKQYPAALEFKETGAGLLLLELSGHAGDYLLCFKPQIKETITWAGNPDKPLQEDGTHKLHPRKSFEKWQQQIEGKSAPWTALELERAGTLIKSVLSIEQRCQARKLKEANGQLQEALEQLEGKNEQLEDFTRIASHNLKSPLNNIFGLLSLYKRKKDQQTAFFALDKIEIVNENMRDTLEDLHQILSIAASKDLPKERVDIGELIEKEKQSLANQLSLAEATIETHLSLPFITYSKIYLESIVHNLVSNALKYRSVDRKLEITIETFEQEGKAVLRFWDNGLGIDLEKHGHKLFGLYKTFHSGKDSKGLGLYLVKKQVEAFKGEIRVDSKVNQGTRFTVVLPKAP